MKDSPIDGSSINADDANSDFQNAGFEFSFVEVNHPVGTFGEHLGTPKGDFSILENIPMHDLQHKSSIKPDFPKQPIVLSNESHSFPHQKSMNDIGEFVSVNLEKVSNSYFPVLPVSPSNSTPLCRICLEGDSKRPLISPCLCCGTVAKVHQVCLERWLSTTSAGKCEICLYKFPIKKVPRSFLEFLTESNDKNLKKIIHSDVLCFSVITFVVVFIMGMCIYWALKLYQESKHNHSVSKTQDLIIKSDEGYFPFEVSLLIFISFVAGSTYLLWIVVSVVYYHGAYQHWRTDNFKVKLAEKEPKLATEIVDNSVII